MTDGNFDPNVCLYKIPDPGSGEIPSPFDPSERYPEYQGSGLSRQNTVYAAIRNIFQTAGYDSARFGTPGWNPLGEFITPGHSVLIKPNMVLHRNYKKDDDYHAVVSHPAIIRAIVDYVAIALGGKGKITIGDAPINSADFEALRRNMGLDAMQELCRARGIPISIADFRLLTMEKDEWGIVRNQRTIDSRDNHIVVRMDRESRLTEFREAYENFRVTEYDGDEMPVRHNLDSHEYCVHRSVLEADVIISIPKIKTHHKAGYTCAMKNYIGINGSKDWLPHHRKYSVAEGGDEYQYPSFRKRLISRSWDARWRVKNTAAQYLMRKMERAVFHTSRWHPFKDPYWEGSWWGNRTISRTVNDLNRAVLYCDKKGALQEMPQRRILYMVDGIICAEGEGPMEATSKRCEMLVWGYNAYCVDMVVVRLMGYDYRKIDTLSICTAESGHPIFPGAPEDVQIRTNMGSGTQTLATLRQTLAFRFLPPKGWTGHIEFEE